MVLRKGLARDRDINKDLSLWNPLFLQMYFSINAVKRFFLNLPESELDIYDFGCGQKPYETFCKDKNYYGIDIDKSNFRADIFADITNVPVESDVADVAVSFFVLEHVSEPKLVLKEKNRILKKGGILFMLVPLYWEEHESPNDFFRYTRYGLEKMLKETGFENIEIKEINSTSSIIGLHLARLFNNKLTRFSVPLINMLFLFFQKREFLMQEKGKMITNVMTYSVKCYK